MLLICFHKQIKNPPYLYKMQRYGGSSYYSPHWRVKRSLSVAAIFGVVRIALVRVIVKISLVGVTVGIALIRIVVEVSLRAFVIFFVVISHDVSFLSSSDNFGIIFVDDFGQYNIRRMIFVLTRKVQVFPVEVLLTERLPFSDSADRFDLRAYFAL